MYVNTQSSCHVSKYAFKSHLECSLQMIKDPNEAYLGINSFLPETQIYPCELDSHHSHKDKITAFTRTYLLL